MKTWKIAVPAVLACALAVSSVNAATTATASSSSPWSFALQGGMGLPNGDFGDIANSGWNIGGQGDYWMNSNWGLGVDLGYHSNSASDAAKTAGLDQVNIFNYGAHATYMIPMQGQFHPYLQAGLGMDNVSAKPVSGSSTSDNKLGWNIGGGADFRATPTMDFGINALYNTAQTDPNSLNWIDVNARVTFRMPSSK